MSKKVALVGHCGPDSSYLRIAIGSVERGVQILAADDDESLQKILAGGVDLLLFNRVLDYGFDTNEGVELIRRLHKFHPNLKMMLVSNYPEAQQASVDAGALPGFGKRDLNTPKAKSILKLALEPAAQEAPVR